MHVPQSLNRYIYCLNNPLKYTDPRGLSEKEIVLEEYEYANSLDMDSMYLAWNFPFLGILRCVLKEGQDVRDQLRQMLLEYLMEMFPKLVLCYSLGLTVPGALIILDIMAYLELIVTNFGDILGITGAFLCIEGMGALFGGLQGGVCLVFHPDLGWAMYLYGGIIVGPMIATGIALIVGFWTWSGERDFVFDDWTKWFYGPEGTAGYGWFSFSGMMFTNAHINPTIEGFGVGVGMGAGFGIAWSSARYKRVRREYAPFWLQPMLAPN